MKAFVSQLVVALFKLLALLPLPLLRWLGAGLGGVLWWQNSRARKTTEENIAICFPHLSPEQSKQLARESVKELGIMAMSWVTPGTGLRGRLCSRLWRWRALSR